jgi:hypothetical protein
MTGRWEAAVSETAVACPLVCLRLVGSVSWCGSLPVWLSSSACPPLCERLLHSVASDRGRSTTPLVVTGASRVRSRRDRLPARRCMLPASGLRPCLPVIERRLSEWDDTRAHAARRTDGPNDRRRRCKCFHRIADAGELPHPPCSDHQFLPRVWLSSTFVRSIDRLSCECCPSVSLCVFVIR